MHYTRDQLRAKHAYHVVSEVEDLKSYKILVNSFGPNVMRSGLAGALAFLQRSKSNDRDKFGEDLAIGVSQMFDVGTNLEDMVSKVHRLDVDTYMLVTRECLELAQWLKRATQARTEVLP